LYQCFEASSLCVYQISRPDQSPRRSAKSSRDNKLVLPFFDCALKSRAEAYPLTSYDLVALFLFLALFLFPIHSRSKPGDPPSFVGGAFEHSKDRFYHDESEHYRRNSDDCRGHDSYLTPLPTHRRGRRKKPKRQNLELLCQPGLLWRLLCGIFLSGPLPESDNLFPSFRLQADHLKARSHRTNMD
jgi:hypothetical protein